MQTKNSFAEKDYRIGSRTRSSQVLIGGFIILIGVITLLRRMGLPIPHWLLSWEMILIGVGILMGVKSGFKDLSWLIPIIIGSIFLSRDIFPDLHFRNYIWPTAIIAIGLTLVLKGNKAKKDTGLFPEIPPQPQKDQFSSGFKRLDEPGPISDTITQVNPQSSVPSSNAEPLASGPEDEIECTAVFGGVKRTVVSKNFKGGEIVAIFGGAEVDLTHSDINGIVKLEATNILGGTKLIVPPTWDVQSEMVAIFGGVEDKRRIQPELINRNKRLVLYGTAFLGGLEIRSF